MPRETVNSPHKGLAGAADLAVDKILSKATGLADPPKSATLLDVKKRNTGKKLYIKKSLG